MLSERQWKLESVLRLVFGLLMCICIGALLTSLLRGSHAANAEPSVMRIVVSMLCFQGATIALVWRFLHEHGFDWARGFGFKNKSLQAVGWGLLAVIVFFPAGFLLQMVSLGALHEMGIETSLQQAVQVMRKASGPAEITILAIITIVLAPIAEEILFRGVLYPTIKEAGFPRAALWITSVVFAAIHLNAAIFLPLLALALLLVWLYEKTDNLLAPIATHAAFNAVNFVLFFMADDIANKLPVKP